MKLLLDTHILLWYRLGNSRLSIALQTWKKAERYAEWLAREYARSIANSSDFAVCS
jgi:PIN domain nuclease of toxin-antitoxin system